MVGASSEFIAQPDRRIRVSATPENLSWLDIFIGAPIPFLLFIALKVLSTFEINWGVAEAGPFAEINHYLPRS